MHVRHADEARDELARGPLVHVGRRTELLDVALVHHRDPVAHRERFLLVVRHVDERDADLALDPLELDLHLLAELQVERAERLVEQEHLGLVDDRARERDALALPARQLHRLAAARARTGARCRAPARPCAAAPARATLRTRSPYSTFSSTVMCGNSA